MDALCLSTTNHFWSRKIWECHTEEKLERRTQIFYSHCTNWSHLIEQTYLVITISRDITRTAVRHFFWMIMCQIIPNRWAFAMCIPSAFYLICRRANSKQEVWWKFPDWPFTSAKCFENRMQIIKQIATIKYYNNWTFLARFHPTLSYTWVSSIAKRRWKVREKTRKLLLFQKLSHVYLKQHRHLIAWIKIAIIL